MYTRNILFSLSATLFSLSIFFSYEVWVFKKLSVVTEGIIISYITEIDEYDNSRVYRPVVGFVTAAGEALKFKGYSATTYKKYEKGESVSVRYNITDPLDVKFDTIFSIWWKCIFSFGFSIVALVFGFMNPSSSDFRRSELDAIDAFISKSRR